MSLGGVPLVLEGFVRFDRELSQIAVRSRTGEVRFYPLVENHHQGGILRRSIAPAAGVTESIVNQASMAIRKVMDHLDYVGILTIEFFQTDEGLVANEMAPRVHNSGHWTIEGARTSQFENHLRAVLGLPLGSTEAVGHCVMVNLIGDAPPTERILTIPGAHLHLYGKKPRPGRKIGHVTLWADTPEEARERAEVMAALGG